MPKEIGIPAIHDDDLKKIIDKYALTDKLNNREISCEICQNEITWDNIYAFAVKNNSLMFYCDSIECTEMINNSHSQHG